MSNQIYFEKLYYEYKTLVFNVALNYLQNLEDAEEVTRCVCESISMFYNPVWQIRSYTDI